MTSSLFGESRPSAQATATQREASVVYFGNEFPNDDLKDVFRRFLQRSRDRRFRVLAAFFEEATLVLKNDTAINFRYVAQRGKSSEDGTTTSNLLPH